MHCVGAGVSEVGLHAFGGKKCHLSRPVELKLFEVQAYKFAVNLCDFFLSSPLLVAIMELDCGDIYEKC
jgi:hypothetical protein